MPHIRITQKLQKEIGFKLTNLLVGEGPFSLFAEWYAHMFFLNRKKHLIFVETQTLFSFCVENVSRKDIRVRFSELFEKGLSKALFVEGVNAQIMSKVMDICRRDWTFSKTEHRRTIGAMNEFVKQHKFCFSYQNIPIEIQDRRNRNMPMRGFPDGSKDLKFSIEVFTKLVKEKFNLDFTTRKD